MPGLIQSYDVLLDFTNDTHDCTSLQLLRDYNNRGGAGAVLIPPGETVTLVLDAGSIYKYVLKTRSKVASVTARAWQDLEYPVSQLFIPDNVGSPSSTSSTSSSSSSPAPSRFNGGGITVDKVWRDMRFCLWDWNDL